MLENFIYDEDWVVSEEPNSKYPAFEWRKHYKMKTPEIYLLVTIRKNKPNIKSLLNNRYRGEYSVAVMGALSYKKMKYEEWEENGGPFHMNSFADSFYIGRKYKVLFKSTFFPSRDAGTPSALAEGFETFAEAEAFATKWMTILKEDHAEYFDN